MKKIKDHLENIKRIQSELRQQYTQAMINLDAINQECGGKTIDGDYVMDREKAIAYFANGKQKIDYSTPDQL